jgi:nucleoid DNA-binding protein
MKKVLKAELAKRIAEKTFQHPEGVLAVLNALDDVIADELKGEKPVYIDNIGTFKRVLKPATRKYIPSKGESVDIPERVVVKLVASKTLVQRVQ